MTPFERDQMFATGLRQLQEQQHEQGRAAFDRMWKTTEAIRPPAQEQQQKAA